MRIGGTILSQRDLDEDTRREFLALSRAQTEKLEFLTQALVKMSRLESGIISYRKETVSATELIGEGLMSVMPAAEEKQIAVQVDCPGRISAYCDKKWTAEAVFNLLDNAVKYTPANGSVTVSADMNEFYAQIRIADSGAGILESEQTKIFGRFYRSEATRHVEGLGIGLFLSRYIIAGQGGYITVRSESGCGAEFTVNLPSE